MYCCGSRQATLLNHDKNINRDSVLTYYKIIKIDEIKNRLYIIYAQKGDSIYKIISEKEESSLIPCKQIREKDIEFFDLTLIFPYKSLLGVNLSGSYYTTIKGLNINGVMVEVEERSNRSLYRANNLKGLCIIKRE
jgi:hypothetical protein